MSESIWDLLLPPVVIGVTVGSMLRLVLVGGVTVVVVEINTLVVAGVGELTRNLTSARKSQLMSEFENVNSR